MSVTPTATPGAATATPSTNSQSEVHPQQGALSERSVTASPFSSKHVGRPPPNSKSLETRNISAPGTRGQSRFQKDASALHQAIKDLSKEISEEGTSKELTELRNRLQKSGDILTNIKRPTEEAAHLTEVSRSLVESLFERLRKTPHSSTTSYADVKAVHVLRSLRALHQGHPAKFSIADINFTQEIKQFFQERGLPS